MDLPIEVVIGGYGAMGAGMIALYRSQVKSQSRCENSEMRLSKKVDELERYQRTEMAEHAERTATLLATAVPLLERALRVLRRHETEHTPPPEDSLRIKHPSGETTAIVRALK